MSATATTRVTASVLDRLLADESASPAAVAAGRAERMRAHDDDLGTVGALVRAIRRDVEALLNARRPWRSPPQHLAALRGSILDFGIGDLAGGSYGDRRQQERLRDEVATAIARFEPRLEAVEVTLPAVSSPLSSTLAMRITALLRVEPAPEPVRFDTVVETATSAVLVRAPGDRRP